MRVIVILRTMNKAHSSCSCSNNNVTFTFLVHSRPALGGRAEGGAVVGAVAAQVAVRAEVALALRRLRPVHVRPALERALRRVTRCNKRIVRWVIWSSGAPTRTYTILKRNTGVNPTYCINCDARKWNIEANQSIHFSHQSVIVLRKAAWSLP